MLSATRTTAIRAREHLRKLEASDVQFDARRARDVYLNAVRTESASNGERQLGREQPWREARVALEAVMQSGVPHPFSAGTPTHLNMPGGGASRLSKYLSDRLQRTHQSNPGSVGNDPSSVE